MTKLTYRRLMTVAIAVSILFSSLLPTEAIVRESNGLFFKEIDTRYQASSWGEVLERLRRRKRKNGTRGSEEENSLCLITPGKLQSEDRRGNIKVWSNKPIFLWHGEMVGIEVRHLRSNELIWSQALEPNINKISYQGEQLQPGQVYFWRETVPLETFPTKVTFRMMEKEERDRITTELAELESRLKAARASKSDIVLARVDYFAEQELWSDALGEIYSLENPSPELTRLMEKISSHKFCLNSQES